MDANFRARQRIKEGDILDFHQHPGMLFFREDEAFAEYLSSVTETPEVSST